MLSLSSTYFSSSEPGLPPWVSAQYSHVPSYRAHPPAGKYHWTKSRVALAVLVQFLSITAFTAWGLYLWFKVKDYGIHHECNDQIKYVVFFVSVKATEPWLRWLWIVVLILSAVGLMIMFGKKAFELLAMVGEEEQAEGPRPWSFFMPFGLLLCVVPPLSLLSSAHESHHSVPRYTPRSC